MSNANKKLLEDLMAEVKNVKKLLDDMSIRHATLEEMGHMSMRLLNDLSAKKDLELCSLNLKTPAVKATKKKSNSATAPSGEPAADTPNTESASNKLELEKMNIMAYFKHKYKEDPKSLYDVISKEEMDTILKKYESELKNKKKSDIGVAKATILYKEFISGNKTNQNRLRSKKEQEVEKATVHKDELEECEVVDEDTVEIEDTVEREDNLDYDSDNADAEDDDDDDEYE